MSNAGEPSQIPRILREVAPEEFRGLIEVRLGNPNRRSSSGPRCVASLIHFRGRRLPSEPSASEQPW